MLFNISELENRKIYFDTTFRPGEIDFSEVEVRQTGLLNASGTVELLSHTLGEVRIQGNVAVTMASSCDRCLEPAEFPIDSAFDLYYRPAIVASDEEASLDEGEVEIAFYEGEELVLEDILREFVLLALPMQRVCRADCKGMCPACGVNRNQIDCDCQEQFSDDRWAALRNL